MAVLLKNDMDLGIFLAHPLVKPHRAGVKGIPQDSDDDAASESLLSQHGGVQAGAVAFQNPGALLGKGPSRRGKGHAAGAAVKELDAQLLLQCRDHPAQGGLGDEQILGGLGKAQPLGEHNKAL